MGKVLVAYPPVAAAVQRASLIPQWIQGISVGQGLSHTYVSEQLGVGRMSLYRWAMGTHAPMTPEVTYCIELWFQRVQELQQRLRS